MTSINNIIADFASFIWGLPLVILLIGGGLYLLVLSKLMPFRYLGHALKVLMGAYDNKLDKGEITHFQALTTALSSTIGMGNIAGVAVAIGIGGPGAMFWMWVSAIIGMVTKFFTCSLSIMFRGKDSAGNVQGGPMYFIVEGLGKSWKPLASFFSVCGLVGALPVFNVNQLKQAINDVLLIPNNIEVTFMSNLIIGFLLVFVTSIVIFGGIKRISITASKLVPTMVLLYFFMVIIILVIYRDQVPKYLSLMVTEAFNAYHYKGDTFLGGVLGGLILLGIRRGAFSNEAGIGTAPMAHGAAKTNEPIREGLVAMFGPAIDTLFICTLTALAILVTGVWQTSDSNGVSLTASAFENAIPFYGKYMLLLCIATFSISSLFSYSYYGTKCMSFLFGDHNKHYYHYVYIASIILGTTTSLNLMLNLIDSAFALMAIPTMIGTIILAPHTLKAFKLYKSKYL